MNKRDSHENAFEGLQRESQSRLFWPTIGDTSDTEAESFPRHYAAWLIRLRWIAILVICSLAALNYFSLHYVEPEPMRGIWVAFGVLLAINIFYELGYGKIYWLIQYGLFLQIGLDLVILTGLLHFSGGMENPFAFAYIFHVILSAIVFERRVAFGVIVFSGLLMTFLAFGEFSGLLDHYTISAFPHFEHDEGPHHASLDLRYVCTQVGLHFLLFALSGGFVTTLMARLHGASAKIRDERLKLQHVIHSTGIGLAIINEDQKIECLNPDDPIWEPIGGQSLEALWQPWLHKLAGQVRERNKVEVTGYETAHAKDEKETRHYQINLSILGNEKSGGTTMAALLWDVTERRRMEAEMSHADRIAMLGQVAAGIAHEVGNPLASISSRLTLLEDCDSLQEIKTGLEPLQGQVARINRIVRGVSQVARPKQGSWMKFDLREAITETLEVLNLHKGSKLCKIICSLPDQPLLLTGVKDQLGQVFLNLGLNALEAMPQGGTLDIGCEEVEDIYRLTISDTGSGMITEIQERVFDLFFTTKKTGLGIGMHISYQILKAHNGSIAVKSEPDRGSCFTITLPKNEGEPSIAQV
jgi:signal transduction histidine kinase